MKFTRYFLMMQILAIISLTSITCSLYGATRSEILKAKSSDTKHDSIAATSTVDHSSISVASSQPSTASTITPPPTKDISHINDDLYAIDAASGTPVPMITKGDCLQSALKAIKKPSLKIILRVTTGTSLLLSNISAWSMIVAMIHRLAYDEEHYLSDEFYVTQSALDMTCLTIIVLPSLVKRIHHKAVKQGISTKQYLTEQIKKNPVLAAIGISLFTGFIADICQVIDAIANEDVVPEPLYWVDASIFLMVNTPGLILRLKEHSKKMYHNCLVMIMRARQSPAVPAIGNPTADASGMASPAPTATSV